MKTYAINVSADGEIIDADEGSSGQRLSNKFLFKFQLPCVPVNISLSNYVNYRSQNLV